jgi:glycosyltransferase involved in cell wall biosynthesis
VRWAPVLATSCSARPDILVFLRNRASVSTRLEAPATVFWMLDNHTDGAALFHDAFHQRGGKIVVASLAFEELLRGAGVAAETVMIRHPIQLDSYPDDSARSLACLYCSVPDRGLDVALTLWPQILARVPEAQLWVTSGYQLWGRSDAEAADGLRVALRGVPVPVNTTFWGPVPQETLWRLQASASLMFYPCRFPELFCISAAECAAAGLPVVTSRIGALSERVVHGRTGILIDGDIADLSTQRAFVDSTVALLLDGSLRMAMGRRGQVLAAECGVERVVSHWEALLN